MKPKQTVLTLAALVLLLGLAAYLSLRTNEAPVNQGRLLAAADIRTRQPADAELPKTEPASGEVAQGKPNKDNAATADAPEPAVDTSDEAPREVAWLIKGKLEIESPAGLDMFSIVRSSKSYVSIGFMTHAGIEAVCKPKPEKQPGDEPVYTDYDDSWDARLADDGAFQVAAYGEHALWTNPVTDGLWQVQWQPQNSGSELFAPAQKTPQAYAALAGIVKPRVSGNVIDLGTVRLALADVLPGDIWACGRILHSSGHALLTSSNQLSLSSFQGEDEVASIGAESDSTGYFLARLDEDFEPMAGMTWRAMEYQPTLEAHVFVSDPLIPTRQSGLLCFGDITVESAALVVKVSGAALQPYHLADNIHSHVGIAQRPYVSVDVQSADDSFDYILWDSETWLLVPPGRVIWQAFAQMTLHPARPHHGVLAVAEGGVSELTLDFAFSETRPIRLVDADGQPVERWYSWAVAIADNQEEWQDSGHGSEFSVPVIQGRETAISIDRYGTDRLQVVLRYEDTELVVTVVDQPQGTLEILIPPAPANWDLDSHVWLMIFRGSSGSGSGIELQTTAFTKTLSLDAGTVNVVLQTPDPFGYFDDCMSRVDGVKVIAGQTVRVELPAIPPAPSSVKIETHVATVHCGGQPIEVEGDFECMRGLLHRHEINGKSSRQLSGLIGLRDGDKIIPFTVTEPTAVDPTWSADLVLPVRLALSLRVGDAWPDYARVTLRPVAKEPYFECVQYLNEGKASMFCTPGLATLTIRGRYGWRETHEVMIERDKTLVLDLKPEKALLRVNFKSTDQDDWQLMHLADSHFVVTNNLSTDSREFERLMEPGRYRLAPALPHPGVEPIEFELRAHDVREIELPDLGDRRPVRDVVFKFDVTQLGTEEFDAYVLAWPKSADPAVATSLGFGSTGLYFEGAIAAEGVKVSLPVGVDMIVGIVLDSENYRAALASRHFTARIEQDTTDMPVSLLPARQFSKDWSKANARFRVAGHLLGVPEWVPIASGTYEFEFLGTDNAVKHAAEVVVKLEPDSDAKLHIPEALLSRLKELRLLPAD